MLLCVTEFIVLSRETEDAIVCDNGRVFVCVCVLQECVCVSGHMLSHRRLPMLSLASGSVCVGLYVCVRDSERGREITVAIANFKVSTGVVPGQHVYTGELVLGRTHIHTHTLRAHAHV